jgi:hypothetical protein
MLELTKQTITHHSQAGRAVIPYECKRIFLEWQMMPILFFF